MAPFRCAKGAGVMWRDVVESWGEFGGELVLRKRCSRFVLPVRGTRGEAGGLAGGQARARLERLLLAESVASRAHALRSARGAYCGGRCRSAVQLLSCVRLRGNLCTVACESCMLHAYSVTVQNLYVTGLLNPMPFSSPAGRMDEWTDGCHVSGPLCSRRPPAPRPPQGSRPQG